MLSDYRKSDLLARTLPGVYVERPRVYGAALRRPPRVLVLVSLNGGGKSVAAHQYVDQLGYPSIVVELQQHDPWQALPDALAAAGLPAAHPRAALAAIRDPMVVLVDRLEAVLDEHGAPSPGSDTWLSLLLHHPFLYVVLASRVLPNFEPLLALAAAGHVQIVDGDALAFNSGEAQALWRMRHGTDLAPQVAETLVLRSGGLAALVALACAAGIPGYDGASLEAALVERMLNALPADLRELLTDLAVLDALTPTAPDAFGSPQPATELLRRLRQHGVITADAPPQIHPLLRQALLERLRTQRRRWIRAVRRAVDVALGEGAYAQAWHYAADANCWEDARRVVLTAAPRMRQDGAAAAVARWIERLPAPQRDHDVLAILAQCQEDTGDLDGALLTLGVLEAGATTKEAACGYQIWLATIHQARGDIATAHTLIMPYLVDASLPPRWRAYVYRIHAIAQALRGATNDAIVFIERSIHTALGLHDQHFLARLYQDHATIAGRVGRLGEAEQALRLAERCYRDLGDPPALAGALNARAMLALTRGDYETATALAYRSRAHALAGGRVHAAAIASATCGDVAFAQGNYAEARLHYDVAADDAERSSDWATRAYSLAWRVHSARLHGDTQPVAQVLPMLRTHPAESAEDAGWIATGVVAAQMALGDVPSIEMVERALDAVGAAPPDVRVALLIVLSQAQWRVGHHDHALATWRTLEDVAQHARGGVFGRLVPLATVEPALLHAAIGQPPAPFAQAALARVPQPVHPALPAAHSHAQATLQVRVLGEERVWWQGEPVTLPSHGVPLLLALLTAPGPIAEDDLLRAVWDEDAVAVHALRKLVVRLNALLPRLIRRAAGQYAVSLPRAEIELDLWNVLDLDLHSAPTEQIVALADAAGARILPGVDAPWAADLRRRLARRAAAMWLEVGRRAEAGDAHVRAHDAFERAQHADPASDLVARAVLQHARRVGDRALVIQRYLHYRRALDDLLGVDPASDLEALYREALEP